MFGLLMRNIGVIFGNWRYLCYFWLVWTSLKFEGTHRSYICLSFWGITAAYLIRTESEHLSGNRNNGKFFTTFILTKQNYIASSRIMVIMVIWFHYRKCSKDSHNHKIQKHNMNTINNQTQTAGNLQLFKCARVVQ